MSISRFPWLNIKRGPLRLLLATLLVALVPGCGEQAESHTNAKRSVPPANLEAIAGGIKHPDENKQPESSEPMTSSPQQASDASSQPTPKLVAKTLVHEFGQMDPFKIGQHRFRISNEGTAPLHFLGDRSTCKCTASFPETDRLAPGESTTILVRWQTQENDNWFDESATIDTNDPEHRQITFRVKGSVRVHMGANPPELLAPRMILDQPHTVETIISSQVWQDFQIAELRCSLDSAELKLLPTTEPERARLNVLSAQRLRVTLPADLPQGEFLHTVSFRMIPAGEDTQAKTFQLPLKGKVLRRVAVYGKGIDHTGRITLGVISNQQEFTRTLVVKVRDPVAKLRVTHSEVSPKDVNVSLVPYEGELADKGVYQLRLTIPENAHVGDYQREKAGTLALHFDHPRIQILKLQLDLAIADRPPGRQYIAGSVR